MDSIELSSDESNQSSSNSLPVFNFVDNFMKMTEDIIENRQINGIDVTKERNSVVVDIIKKRKIDEIEVIKLVSSDSDDDATDDELLPKFPVKADLPLPNLIEKQNNLIDSETKFNKFPKCGSSLSSKSSSGVFSQSDNEDNCEPIELEIPNIESNAPLPKKKKSRNNTNSTKENKAKEKNLKKALAEEQKSLRPNECLKHMFVEIGPQILNRPYANKILEVIHSYGIKHISDSPIFSNSAIGWKRQLPRCLENNDDGKIQLSSDMKDEPFMLFLVDMEELEQLLISKTLNSQIHFVKESSKCQVTLLLYGSKSYFKLKANKKNAKLKNNVRAKISNNVNEINDNQGILTENDVEYYLTKLLFEESVNCRKAETPDDLAYAIYQFTKAIAECPFKNAKKEIDQQADFYMRGENKKCVVIDKEGNGLLNYWCQTLTKFPLASLETSQAICQKYPSPALLLEMIRNNCKDDAIKSLSEIGIRRANGPSSISRKLGPELAKKIYTFYTSTDGNELLM